MLSSSGILRRAGAADPAIATLLLASFDLVLVDDNLVGKWVGFYHFMASRQFLTLLAPEVRGSSACSKPVSGHSLLQVWDALLMRLISEDDHTLEPTQ